MSALAHSEATVLAHPLGIPLDGRKRFSMTPEQARIYAWIVTNVTAPVFPVNSREVGAHIGISHSRVHDLVCALIERGWLYRVRGRTHLETAYGFVQPVMRFSEPSRPFPKPAPQE